MKLYVNTEQIEAIEEALSSLKNCLTTEYSKLKNTAHNLQGQSISTNSICSAIQNIHNIENEINLLVQKLRKIKNIYDATEYGVLNDIRHLPGALVSKNIAPQVTIYKSTLAAFSHHTRNGYITFVSAIPKPNNILCMRQLFLRKNMKEFPRVMNRILALNEEQSEAWLIEKLREWMRDHIRVSTGYIPFELPIQTLDATDLF